MNNEIYNKLIIIYNEETNGVICQVNSDTIANALCGSMLNLRFASFPIHEFPIPNHPNDFDDIKKHYQLTPIKSFDPLPDQFITEEWINLRELILQKRFYMELWEFRVRQQVSRVNDFFGNDILSAFVIDQLKKCDVNTGYFTAAIQEWADTQECSPDAAYRELKIRQEGQGLLYLRAHALYDKHTKIICSSNTANELKNSFNDALNKLFGAAEI